jgi:hypothetical protein
MAKADDCILKFQASTSGGDRKTRDAYLYDACVALKESGLSSHNIRTWMDYEVIPFGSYSNHLVELASRFPTTTARSRGARRG